MSGEILRLEGVTKRFGGLTANQDISFSVEKGDVIGLIGPNGAGKSTLFNCISCFYRASAGRILFRGEEITNDTPETACRKGIGRTFQIVRIFKEMSVLENIMIGAFLKYDKTKAAANRAGEVAELFGFSQGSADRPARSQYPSRSAWKWRAPSPRGRRYCCLTR